MKIKKYKQGDEVEMLVSEKDDGKILTDEKTGVPSGRIVNGTVMIPEVQATVTLTPEQRVKAINNWALNNPDRVFGDDFIRLRRYITEENWAQIIKKLQNPITSITDKRWDKIPNSDRLRSKVFSGEVREAIGKGVKVPLIAASIPLTLIGGPALATGIGNILTGAGTALALGTAGKLVGNTAKAVYNAGTKAAAKAMPYLNAISPGTKEFFALPLWKQLAITGAEAANIVGAGNAFVNNPRIDTGINAGLAVLPYAPSIINTTKSIPTIVNTTTNSISNKFNKLKSIFNLNNKPKLSHIIKYTFDQPEAERVKIGHKLFIRDSYPMPSQSDGKGLYTAEAPFPGSEKFKLENTPTVIDDYHTPGFFSNLNAYWKLNKNAFLGKTYFNKYAKQMQKYPQKVHLNNFNKSKLILDLESNPQIFNGIVSESTTIPDLNKMNDAIKYVNQSIPELQNTDWIYFESDPGSYTILDNYKNELDNTIKIKNFIKSQYFKLYDFISRNYPLLTLVIDESPLYILQIYNDGINGKITNLENYLLNLIKQANTFARDMRSKNNLPLNSDNYLSFGSTGFKGLMHIGVPNGRVLDGRHYYGDYRGYYTPKDVKSILKGDPSTWWAQRNITGHGMSDKMSTIHQGKYTTLDEPSLMSRAPLFFRSIYNDPELSKIKNFKKYLYMPNETHIIFDGNTGEKLLNLNVDIVNKISEPEKIQLYNNQRFSMGYKNGGIVNYINTFKIKNN